MDHTVFVTLFRVDGQFSFIPFHFRMCHHWRCDNVYDKEVLSRFVDRTSQRKEVGEMDVENKRRIISGSTCAVGGVLTEWSVGTGLSPRATAAVTQTVLTTMSGPSAVGVYTCRLQHGRDKGV